MDNKQGNTLAANYIRDYAHHNGKFIYDFMNANDIGHSTYGRFMDKAAQGKKVIAHRLYGHHLIYDFPTENVHDIAPFLEHLFSDLFTKQGLPIIPGEMLNDAGLLKCCDSIKRSWNFVNGFDILSGTVAVFQGVNDFDKYFVKGYSVDSFTELANSVGIGALELAIALSTANPFLLIGGILSLTSGLTGMINEGAVIYFSNINHSLSVEFSQSTLNVESYIQTYRLEKAISSLSIESELKKIEFPYNF